MHWIDHNEIVSILCGVIIIQNNMHTVIIIIIIS